MPIRPLVKGFEILNANGGHFATAYTWAEALTYEQRVDYSEALPPPPVERVETTTEMGCVIHYPAAVEQSKQSSASAISCKKPWRSTAMAVPIHQAKDFMKDAPAGVSYEPSRTEGFADLVCDSRASRAAEMKRRNKFDRDAGYSDYSGK